MNLEISLVPIGHISPLIPGLLPHLQKSELWTRGRSTVDDILRSLFVGQMQLWVVFSQEGKNAPPIVVALSLTKLPKAALPASVVGFIAFNPAVILPVVVAPAAP